MGSVYKKTATKPVPKGAELFTKAGEQYARWKPAKGKTRTAPVTMGKDGTDRIVITVGTYIAKFRDGSGTGLRSLDGLPGRVARPESSKGVANSQYT